MKTKILSALILSITLLLLLGLVEFALRYVGLGDPVVYNTNLTFRYYSAPNQKKSRIGGASVSINEHSLRATRSWSESAKFKVLFFGDSVTYGGSYIDDKQLFSELVCERLNKPTSRDYLCGNAGTNAYGTDNIANRITHDSINDENLLVVTLIGGDAFRSLQNISALPYFMESPAYLPATQEIVLHAAYNLMNRVRGAPSNDDAAMDTATAKNSLLNLKQTLLAQSKLGKSIILVVSPSKDEAIKGKLEDGTMLIHQVFGKDDGRIRVINMIDHVSTSDIQKIFYDDIHLNEAGHALFANVIADVVKSLE